MDHLPAGHPSSAYEADGRLRQPTPRLRDLHPADGDEDPGRAASGPAGAGDNARPPDASGAHDARAAVRAGLESSADVGPATDRHPNADAKALTERASDPPGVQPPTDQVLPLTDAKWAEHITDVRARLADAHAHGLETDDLYTIDDEGEIWSDERVALHDAIIEDLLAKSYAVPREHKALIAGGLGGSGKSTVLDQYAGIDRSQYLTINPDDLKEELARRGLVPQVDGLSPMEASELVHEETSYIAKQLALRAQAEDRNIIWDITMSTPESMERRVDELRASGYERIEGLFVDIPVEISIARADSRHREDHEKYRAGNGVGGRYVPPEVTKAQADLDWGSQNRRTFEGIKHRFDSWSRYDNSVDGRAPLLVEASTTRDFEHEEAPR